MAALGLPAAYGYASDMLRPNYCTSRKLVSARTMIVNFESFVFIRVNVHRTGDRPIYHGLLVQGGPRGHPRDGECWHAQLRGPSPFGHQMDLDQPESPQVKRGSETLRPEGRYNYGERLTVSFQSPIGGEMCAPHTYRNMPLSIRHTLTISASKSD